MASTKNSFALPNWLAGKRFLSVIAVIYIAFAISIAWQMLGRPTVGADDANIFFVYARNFIHGHGIVYNVGGEHVEGFSSPLYFAVCSLAYAGSSSPEKIPFALNSCFTILASLCVISAISDIADRFQLSVGIRFLLSAAYFLWLLFNPCYFAWNAVSLMDTSIYSLVITADYAWLAHAALAKSYGLRRSDWQLCGLIILTALSRPEGIVWAVLLFAGYAWIEWNPESQVRDSFKQLLRAPLVSLVATPAALVLFRLIYFGYPLPNTYYAKVSSSLSATLRDGWQYLTGFVGFYGFFCVLPLCVLILWIGYAAFARPRTKIFLFACLTAVFSLAALLLPVLDGGDHFYGFRMYQPVMPVLFFSMMFPVLLLAPFPKRFAQYGYVVILIAVIVFAGHDSWGRFVGSNKPSGAVADMRMRVVIEFYIAADQRENGAHLHQLFQDDLPTAGFGSAGGIAYGYQGTVYDMMGLNNVRMAHADSIKTGPKGHQSFNKDVFYELAPDLLMPRAVPAGIPVDLAGSVHYFMIPGSWDNEIFKGIFNDPKFRSTYTFAWLANSARPEYTCYGYFKNTYLAKLSKNKNIALTYVRY